MEQVHLFLLLIKSYYEKLKKICIKYIKKFEEYCLYFCRIVETMSYNDNVANFLEAQNELESINMADLEMVAGDVIERVKSQPNSPFGKLFCQIWISFTNLIIVY